MYFKYVRSTTTQVERENATSIEDTEQSFVMNVETNLGQCKIMYYTHFNKQDKRERGIQKGTKEY